MFSLRSPSPRSCLATSARQVRLAVERLESRDCPSPTMLSFNCSQNPNNWWCFSGRISDTNGVTNDMISFSGGSWINNQTVNVNSEGGFSLVIQVPSGTYTSIAAWAVDLNSATSNILHTMVVQS